MLLGPADCVDGFALLQRNGLLQHQLNGRAHVDEEVVRAGEHQQ
jgi:hypothetical protein